MEKNRRKLRTKIRLRRGKALERQGLRDEAVKELKAVLLLEPTNVEVGVRASSRLSIFM